LRAARSAALNADCNRRSKAGNNSGRGDRIFEKSLRADILPDEHGHASQAVPSVRTGGDNFPPDIGQPGGNRIENISAKCERTALACGSPIKKATRQSAAAGNSN